MPELLIDVRVVVYPDDFPTEQIDWVDLAPCWIRGLPMETYLAIPAMSASGMKYFRLAPARFRKESLHPKEPTAAMLEGVALHMALLEPGLFERTYVVLGQCEAKKKGDGLRCENPGVFYRDGQSFCAVKGHDPYDKEPMREGVHVVSEDLKTRIEGGRRAVMADVDAAAFFRGRGHSEVVGLWRDETTGVPCKIRLDRDIERAALHADVKWTDVELDDATFSRHMANQGWVRRSSWYRRGMEALDRPAEGSVLIAVSQKPVLDTGKGPEHACRTFLLDEDEITAYGRDIDEQLARYADCVTTDTWPGYRKGLVPIKSPHWALPKQAINDFGEEEF